MSDKIMFNIRTDFTTKELLKAACDKRGLKISYVINKLIKNWIKKQDIQILK